MRLRLGPTSLSLAALLSSACFQDVQDDVGTGETAGDGDGDGDSGDGDGDSGDGDSGDGDGDGDTANDDSDQCEPGLICVDEPIAGWEGPLLVYTGPVGEPSPACQGDVPVKVAELFSDLETNEGPGTCGCECSPMTSVTCAGVTLRQSNNQACLTVAKMWTVDPDECQDLGGVQASTYYSANEPDMLDASCNSAYTQELMPAAHNTQILACTVDDGAQECGTGGVCLPPADAPFDGRVCIATEGDVQCPSGSYTDRVVYYSGVDDNRSCGACSCEAPPGAKCSGEVRLMSMGCGLQGFLMGLVNTGDCSNSIGNASFADFAPDPPAEQGGCAPTGGGIDGDVDELGAMTFCCQ